MNEPNSVVGGGGLPVAEMNEPNSVVGGGGLPVAEMNEPNSVIGGGGLPVAEMKEPNSVVGGLPVAEMRKLKIKDPNSVVAGGLPVAEMNEPNSVVGGLPVAEMRKLKIKDPNSVVAGGLPVAEMRKLKIKHPDYKKLEHPFKELAKIVFARRWSKLPPGPLELIVRKVAPSVDDILRFKMVCRSWRNAVKSFALCHQNPWLLLHTNHRSSIFDPAAETTYILRSVYEDFDGAQCMGSSNGYIIIFHCDKESNDSLAHLFNPLTRARFQIPGIQSLPSFSSRASILKVIVSSSFSTTHHPIVAMAYNTRSLAFCELGDKTWKKLEENMLRPGCGDIMFHGNKLFALALDESLEVWAYEGSSFVKKAYLPSSFPILDYPYYRVTRLVVSSGAVLRLRKSGQYEDPIAQSFTVEKLNLEDIKWEQVHKLGDQILFMFDKYDQLMSLSNPCFLKCEDNSICFGQGSLYVYSLTHNTHNTVSRMRSLPRPLEHLQLYNEDTAVWLIPNFFD